MTDSQDLVKVKDQKVTKMLTSENTTSQKPSKFKPNSPWCYDPFIYRVFYGSGGVDQPIVHEVCHERGWREYGDEQKKLCNAGASGWNLWWRCSTLTVTPMRTLYSWQFTNQIPRGIGICNKEYLRHFFIFLKKEFGPITDFGPITYILPKEWELLMTENGKRLKLGRSEDNLAKSRSLNLVAYPDEKTGDQFKPLWISKPVGKSQGKGIKVTDDLLTLHGLHTTTVVQEYIARPMLISGYKFDLRVYVAVTSTNPMTLYVYREGLTRFATQKYDLNDLSNSYSHLTNASLNKYGTAYNDNKEGIGRGCKWSFERLRRYFLENGIDDFFLWQRIWSILVLTIVGECNRMASIPYTKNCFAFLGYDILIDETMRPYLLEVNLAPGLNADSDVDTFVKKPMLHQLFDLIGLPYHTPKRKKVASRLPQARPETSPAVPPSYYRPTTVERALALIDVQNINKFGPGTKLRQRLIDMTAIYTQDLSGHLRRIQQQNPNLGKTKIPDQKAERTPDIDEKQRKTPSTTKNGALKPSRDWTNPMGQCGNWFRMFPFDELSHNESRGVREMNLHKMASNLNSYIQDVRDICEATPGQPDQFYVDAIGNLGRLNTQIWFPKIAEPPPAPIPDIDEYTSPESETEPEAAESI